MNPTYLQGPSPKGRQQQAIQCVLLADAGGYDGYTTEIGTSSIQDPLLVGWQNDLKAVVEKCAEIHNRRKASGGHFYLRLRLLPNVPTKTYSNGVETGLSPWVTRYGAGVAWPSLNRPILQVLPTLAKLVWQVALDIAISAYGDDAKSCVSAQGVNELGVGGNGTGGQKGPMGYIEPYAGSMVCTLLQNFDPRGTRFNPLGLEGDHTKASNGKYADQNEVDSIKGTDWSLVFSDPKTYGVDFNRYGSYGTSAATVANNWATRAAAEIALIHANPLMKGRPLFIQEMGDKASNWPTSKINTPRQAILAKSRTLAGIEGASMFTAVKTSGASAGFELWNADGSPVGGNVGPLLIGGTS